MLAEFGSQALRPLSINLTETKFFQPKANLNRKIKF